MFNIINCCVSKILLNFNYISTKKTIFVLYLKASVRLILYLASVD